MSPKLKRNELTLEQKVNVIKELEKSGKSQRELATIFGTRKTQIQSILKRKREYTEAFELNTNAGHKRRCNYAGENDDINSLVWLLSLICRALHTTVCFGVLIKMCLCDFIINSSGV